MTAVNETIVREYFESLGYLTIQPKKHIAVGRARLADDEIDLLVQNPSIPDQPLPENLVWADSDLRRVSRAVVAVRGWHTDRFYASTFEKTPELLRFAEPEPMRAARELLGSESVAKVLCLSWLPASGELRRNTIRFLRDRGVDGVISFRTILLGLIQHVEVNRNYEKSDLLQTLRILKSQELLKDGQMELFARRGKRADAHDRETPPASPAAEQP